MVIIQCIFLKIEILIMHARAMSTLGFDKYVEPLKIYLGKYRESVRGDRPDKKTGNRKDLIPSASFMTSPTMAHFPYEHPSGMTFLSDHTVPMIAPGKGEVCHVGDVLHLHSPHITFHAPHTYLAYLIRHL